MAELNRIFSELKVHFGKNISYIDLEDWLGEDENNDELTTRRHARKFWSQPMCQQELQLQDAQLQVLRDLSNCIRTIRTDDSENQNSFDVDNDNWAKIEDIAPKEYLAYIYAVSSLATLPQETINAAPIPLNENINVRLSLNAVSAYLLSLTIPGAKSYGIFDEGVIEHCLRVFRLLELNANNSVLANNVWIQFLTICDDLKLVFRYVHFKDHLTPRDSIIRSLLEIIYMNFKLGYKNSCAKQLHVKCFELFDEIANEHNGDVYETLMLFMNMTFCMHIFPENSKLFQSPQSGQHISDWFVKLLEKYPDIISRVLHNYIECVVTNPVKEWKIADEKIALGYAAKYDAALYAKCNKSCTDILLNTIIADDAVGIQTRTLELIERILQQQTQVEWSLFRHDVSTKPREVALIRELIRCLNDKTFSVRRKASQMLCLVIKQGSPITIRILTECITFVQYTEHQATPTELNRRQLELNLEKPGVLQYAYSFEGHEELEPVFKKLPQIIYDRFLNSSNGIARSSGIAILERLVLINPRIIYDTDYEQEMSPLAVDMLPSVRKAALESMDVLLQNYYNCSILIDIYCRIWPCLLSDEDISLQKLALHSFNRNVLMNIKPLEYTNQPKHLLPWRIVTTLLSQQPRDYLQAKLTLLLANENIVTASLVNTIISHLTTSMATEAWTLLLFISSRITNNLDALITTFDRLSSFNMRSNQVLALQLTSYCLSNFSKAALNQLFKRLLSALGSGSIWLALVSPALLLLKHTDQLSLSQAPQNSVNVDSWQLKLLDDLTASITERMDNFELEHIRMLSLLATYTELIAMVPKHADKRISNFVLNYLQLCTELSESSFDTDNERIMNWMVVIAGRLSLRDNDLANKLAKLYNQILTKNDRPQLINSTLIGMNDLGKKYPTILESNMKCILIKLRSTYATTRVRTYRCVKDVILAGNIKLKGPILIALLAGLVDESSEVAHEADAFFIRYKKLYDKLLFHHCLKECPFDLNDQAFLRGSGRVEAGFKSPLRGADMLKKRRLLYNHIMYSLDDNTLLLYFGQLKLLAEKTKDDAFIKARNALDVIVDILFIMRRICFCTKIRRQQGGEQDDEAAEEETPAAPTLPTEPEPTTSNTNATPKGRGRGARKRELAEEPLKQLERCLRYVEETHRNMSSVMTAELQQQFDKLCRAMCMRFSNYTDFAQPAEFWQKYKRNKPSKSKAKRRRINEDGDDDDEERAEEESDADSDNELPLARHKMVATSTSACVQRRGNYDVLATELIFQPHDW